MFWRCSRFEVGYEARSNQASDRRWETEHHKAVTVIHCIIPTLFSVPFSADPLLLDLASCHWGATGSHYLSHFLLVFSSIGFAL